MFLINDVEISKILLYALETKDNIKFINPIWSFIFLYLVPR